MIPSLIYLHDTARETLRPFTEMHTGGELRIGRHSFCERLRSLLPDGPPLHIITQDFMLPAVRKRYPEISAGTKMPAEGLIFAMNIFWTKDAVFQILNHDEPARFTDPGGRTAAIRRTADIPDGRLPEIPLPVTRYDSLPELVNDLPELIRKAIRTDADSKFSMSSEQYLHPDASVHPTAVLDTSRGPVMVDAGAIIEAGAVIYGPAYIGENASAASHACIRTSVIGPECRAGGEIKQSILHGFSQKGHTGYLGDSFIGEWCNLGAGSICSNMKNTAGTVSLIYDGKTIPGGFTKCGLFTGDHCHAAVGSLWYTGSTVGTASTLFGEGILPRDIPSGAWGGHPPFSSADPERLTKMLNRWMAFKNRQLSPAERELIFRLCAKKR